ncbi:MAG: hypothetical protein JWR85_462 [Marmoricola sp.]|nr:hypothetical protein [Marmoricola sp.]
MKKLALAALLASTVALSGCAALSDDAGPGGSGDGVHVVAAFYPLQYVAQRVSGDLAVVTNLTRPGGEPHDLEIPPKETAEIVDADLVLYEKGFQPAVDDAVEQNASGATVDAAEVADLQPSGHDGHDHGTEDHGAESGQHGDLDPHFWQDPLRLADVGDAVAEQLGKVDPDHAGEYAANAEDLRADLEALDQDYETGLAGCERSTVVVSHDAFGYLTKYGLDMEPIAGLSPGAEPTPADLVRLQELIRSDGITTVFSERLVSPRISQSLADDMHVLTAVLDPIEGLSDQTANETYLSLMKQNLAALEKANACR